MIEVLFKIFTLILLFLLNPLLLVGLIITLLLGYFRLKQERRLFRIGLLPGLTEFKRLLSESWMYGLALSILIFGLVLSVDLGWLVLFYIFSFLVLLSFNFKFISPIYFAVAAFLGVFLLDFVGLEFFYIEWSPSEIDLFGGAAAMIAVIAGLLLIIEGLLIRGYAARYVSPFFIPTNRGLRGVAFKAKQLWLLPVLFLIPGNLMTDIIPNWPEFQFGNTIPFTLVPVPIVIGFSQVIRSTYPDILLPKLGRSVIFIGVIMLVIGIGGFWLPVLGVTALLIGFVGRATISIVSSNRNRKGKLVVVPQSEGIVIAGVLPNSPGKKMGLITGECIQTVNGEKVNSEKELYKAIQKNAHYCSLQVNNRNGELRILKQEIYYHDHHLLGILIVQ